MNIYYAEGDSLYTKEDLIQQGHEFNENEKHDDFDDFEAVVLLSQYEKAIKEKEDALLTAGNELSKAATALESAAKEIKRLEDKATIELAHSMNLTEEIKRLEMELGQKHYK